MVKRVGFAIAVSVLTLLATACIPTSENPLSAPGDFATDGRLEGVWQEDLPEPRTFQYLHFVRVNDALMDLDAVRYTYEAPTAKSTQEMLCKREGVHNRIRECN